jgi:hypothetical protein
MLGGAYAASNNSSGKATASAKAKKGPRGPKGATGPAGPQGPAGAQGVPGAKGDAGANGAVGGVGPTGPQGPAGPKGSTGAAGPPGPTGPEGSPWTAGGTLPAGKTETGVWAGSFQNVPENSQVMIPISFPIPLASASEKAFYFNVTETELEEFGKDETTNKSCVVGAPECIETGCSGTVENPTAAPGLLCVYTSEGGGEGFNFLPPHPLAFSGAIGYQPSGTVLRFSTNAEAARFEGNGYWAVTAPPAP